MKSLLFNRRSVPGIRLCESATRHRLHAGQHAVITSGSSGLGLELAAQLARRGLCVTLVARDLNRLQRAQAQVTGSAPAAKVRVRSLDVTDFAAIQTALTELDAATGAIDVLINSAGIVREGYYERLDREDLRAVMDVNFFGVYNTTTACLPYLKKSRGRIVNIGSMAGLIGAFGMTAYCAAKHALTGFSGALRIELEPQNVTVQLVFPPEFNSPMPDVLHTYRTPENRAQVRSFQVLEVAQVANETIRGIQRGDHLIIPGATSRLGWRTTRFAPHLMHRFLQHRLATVYQGPTANDAPVIPMSDTAAAYDAADKS